ncbi:MAG: tRNA epoxyqueuosine(34) reductase QueG [Gammaproteobacteria bacterium]|nr:tRNA epoxyqueuosine(34) reductase QueG [Gammaproteobacteria bacterium]
MTALTKEALSELALEIKTWGKQLGFQEIGIADTDLHLAETRLNTWLDKGMHGEMSYMQRHGTKRTHPEELIPGTTRIIMGRMDYLPADPAFKEVLNNPTKAFVSRYAQDKDYHKLIRSRLQKLASLIEAKIGEFQYRAFVDSAPVMEKPLAQKAGLGWIGKHTNLINPKAGSWFFLGSLYTDLPLPIDETFEKNHCGSCSACIDICPTQAIIGPYQLDARRCISYLTIELKGPIPEEFRKMLGNRIYGCDDCQLVCPWNKFAKTSNEMAFQANRDLKSPNLLDLFTWSEAEFLKKTEGSAIRRIGHEKWLSNIAIALGNAPSSAEIIQALQNKLDYPSELIKEHVKWALSEHLYSL